MLPAEKERLMAEDRIPMPPVLPEDRPEEWLERVIEEFLSQYGSTTEYSNAERYELYCTQAMEILTQQIENQPKTKFSSEKQQQILSELTDPQIIPATKVRPPEKDASGRRSYIEEGRERHRAFLYNAKTHSSSDTYCWELLRMKWRGPEAKAYYHRIVDGKNIWLLGGADSAQDLIAEDEFHPASIVNIYNNIETENPTKNPRDIYESYEIDVTDSEAIRRMRESENRPLADEMWALFSVPPYLETPEEIRGMCKTVVENLAPGGTARFAPLTLSEKNADELRNTLVASLTEIAALPDFNVYRAGEALFIERLPA